MESNGGRMRVIPFQTIGFTFEAFSFIYGGLMLGLGKWKLAILFLVIAFALASWTGKQIEKDAVNKFKEDLKS